MKLDNLKQIINEELENYFKTNSYSLKDELIITNEVIMGELLNPDYSYPYEGKNGYYEYKDMNGVTFFVRLTYHPSSHNYMEFKTGWLDSNNKPQYEPSVPPHSPNSSSKDMDRRSDTVAKIFRDEILPLFDSQDLTSLLMIKPISSSRMKFAERLVKKFTPEGKYNIEYGSPLIISKK